MAHTHRESVAIVAPRRTVVLRLDTPAKGCDIGCARVGYRWSWARCNSWEVGWKMQELRVCVYEADDGPRVGSVDEDRVYDLNLCCAARLDGQGVADPFGVAGVMAPPGLDAFLAGGDQALVEARRSLEWAIGQPDGASVAGRPLSRSLEGSKLKAPITRLHQGHLHGPGLHEPRGNRRPRASRQAHALLQAEPGRRRPRRVGRAAEAPLPGPRRLRHGAHRGHREEPGGVSPRSASRTTSGVTLSSTT